MAMARRFANGLPLFAALVLNFLGWGRAQSMRGSHVQNRSREQSMRGDGGTSHGRLWFISAGQMQDEDLELALGVELADHSERMARLEDGLRTLFTALPKTEQGRLGHEAVRYALQRFFLNLNGWLIRGLEPGNRSWTRNESGFFKEWVPARLEELFEARIGEAGADLHDVAALAAALEDLIKQEAAARLSMVYEASGFQPEQALARTEITDVLMSFFFSFEFGHNITMDSSRALRYWQQKHMRENAASKAWFQDVIERHFGKDHGLLGESKLHDFREALGVVADLNQNYHTFYDAADCRDLKDTLAKLEGRKPGRVRLSTFYNATHTRWVFAEGKELLRSLGALDDTDPKNPSVIIPNYAMSRSNCQDASHVFSICCGNACEGMMGHLEAELASDGAEPEKIAALLGQLPSESVEAPRTLPQSLLSRLDEIAVYHGGRVPIHGRLFAQWMHHAYPLECPYPHEQGSSPQTSAEGKSVAGSGAQATKEEMQETVEADRCAIDWHTKSECAEESTELPWSMGEELIFSQSVDVRSMKGQGVAASSGSGVRRMLLVLLSLVALAGVGIGIGSNAKLLGQHGDMPQHK